MSRSITYIPFKSMRLSREQKRLVRGHLSCGNFRLWVKKTFSDSPRRTRSWAPNGAPKYSSAHTHKSIIYKYAWWHKVLTMDSFLFICLLYWEWNWLFCFISLNCFVSHCVVRIQILHLECLAHMLLEGTLNKEFLWWMTLWLSIVVHGTQFLLSIALSQFLYLSLAN